MANDRYGISFPRSAWERTSGRTVEPGTSGASATFAGSTAVTTTTTTTGVATAPLLQANGITGDFKVLARVVEDGVFLGLA